MLWVKAEVKGKYWSQIWKEARESSSQLMANKKETTRYPLTPEEAKTHLFQHINSTLLHTPATILMVGQVFPFPFPNRDCVIGFYKEHISATATVQNSNRATSIWQEENPAGRGWGAGFVWPCSHPEENSITTQRCWWRKDFSLPPSRAERSFGCTLELCFG